MNVTTIFSVFLFVVLCCGDLPCNKVKKENGYVCVCNATYCDTINRPNHLASGKFHFYYTSEDSPGFNHETGHFRKQDFFPYGYKFQVNRTKMFQKIRGFGGSFTDSFGAVLSTLSNDAQENLLHSYFGVDGIEYTVCRIVIGSSDFSLRNYNYLPNYDPTLRSFNLTEDDHIYKIANIKKAIQISKKHINFLGSAWMAPSWIKIGNTSGTRYLKPEFRQLWADYHVKTLDAYRKEGIEFWALTPGNEPITLFIAKASSVILMFPEEQREFVINNLGPALEKANYSTKIYVLDDMRIYATWYMKQIMRDEMAKKYVSGIALHFYTDTYSSTEILDEFHEKYSNQEIIYTESSVSFFMYWRVQKNLSQKEKEEKKNSDQTSSADKLKRGRPLLGEWNRGRFYAENIIQNLNHWTTTYIDWNLALNEKGGPNLLDSPCDASIIVNVTADEFYKQPMFFVMGHFSKFIHPDAVIIQVNSVKIPQNPDNLAATDSRRSPLPNSETTSNPEQPLLSDEGDLQYISALNPNGSISVIFHNQKSSSVPIQIHDPDRGLAFVILEPNSLSTIFYW